MVTALKPEHEANAAVAETAAAPTAVVERAAPATAPVDISVVPETPAELLKQWDTPRHPLLHTVIAATLVRIWDALTGPGMTEQERVRREIAESNGYVRVRGPHV